MQIKILLLLLLLPIFLPGQETVKVTKKNEVYYVLKSDPKIRHGLYQSLGCDGLPADSGYYNYGLKDSIWDGTFYKGTYSKGEKVGLWIYYDFYRVVSEIYDYSSGELSYYKVNEADSHKLYRVVLGLDTSQSELDRPPMILGRDLLILETLVNHLSGLKKVIKHGDSGAVYFQFIVDTAGGVSDYKMTKGTGTAFDKEAQSCIDEFKKGWLPGMLKGKAVASDMNSVVSYKIERRRFRIRKNASVSIGFF